MTLRRRRKIIFCCCLFLAAAVLKLGFADKTTAIRNKVSDVIGKNIDYKETFSQIGKAISSEGELADVFGEIYVAVFGENDSSGVQKVSGETTIDTAADEAVWAAITGEEKYFYPEALRLMSLAYHPEETQKTEGETIEKPVETAIEESNNWTPAETIDYEYPDVEAPEDATTEYVDLVLECIATPGGEIVSSEYGYRHHPVYGELKFHYGIDYAMELNENVYAFADGVVYAAGEESSLGKYLMIDHGNGIMTLYAHLNEFRISEGSTVSVGDNIAGAGETGLATGVNLHFELWINDVAVNPLWYLT